jgi:hypothetical protein
MGPLVRLVEGLLSIYLHFLREDHK